MRTRLLGALCALLLACDGREPAEARDDDGGADAGTDTGTDAAALPCGDDRDDDGDGFAGCLDCDDRDPDVGPGVNEGFCCSTNLDDGVDNDCDGAIDERPLLRGCTCSEGDPDGDGYLDRFDCGPEDATVNPGVVEGQWCAADRHDGKDNDCDGAVDEIEDARPCDADYDGTPEEDDCDDADGWVHPDWTESCCRCAASPGDYRSQQCDGKDNDCDGQRDEAPACDCDQPDADLDGFRAGDDCDDSDFNRSPGMRECCCPAAAPQSCNERDDDCDGDVDESPRGCCQLWYGSDE